MPRGNSFSPIDGWKVISLLKAAGWDTGMSSGDHIIASKAGERQIVIRPTAITLEAVVAAEREH